MDTNGNGYAVGTGNSNGPVGTVFKASAADDFATWTDISPAGISVTTAVRAPHSL